jgi:hypothetical protein
MCGHRRKGGPAMLVDAPGGLFANARLRQSSVSLRLVLCAIRRIDTRSVWLFITQPTLRGNRHCFLGSPSRDDEQFSLRRACLLERDDRRNCLSQRNSSTDLGRELASQGGIDNARHTFRRRCSKHRLMA